ncbi:glycerol-3-phosphate dehydrogenase/oxidase [soil metagenome]
MTTMRGFTMDRNKILDRIRNRTEPWDIVVIGGGATGVGCAVDAASRGYDVLLLEQHDFGKGTSSRSTKLVHGGVRYLAQGNISLVREALKERGILLQNAPHVVHKQSFIVPCYSLWEKIFYRTGLKVYDLLSGKYSFGRSRILSADKAFELLPTVAKKGLAGGVLYYDGQFDDARLLIDLVATGIKSGATFLNYAKVRSLTKTADFTVNGVEFEDTETGEGLSAPAKVVINATGVFCDSVRGMSDPRSKPIVTLSQGIHLVFDKKFLPSDHAIMIPKTSDGRVLFCIPWHGYTLVGTTDTPIRNANLEPHVLESEIDFVLDTAGEYLTEKPTRDDILSKFVGIRPLVRSDAAANTSALSRGHTIEIDKAGLLTITGGKWTTYRHMAEDAVDQAARLAGLENRPSVTRELSISAPETTDDTELLHPDLSYFVGEVLRGVRTEMARTVEDVLARRTRALFLNAKTAIEISPKVARIIAGELGKDEVWISDQVAEFKKVAGNYLSG